jgi:glycosyltransferase involved in cell wall biosynthesis
VLQKEQKEYRLADCLLCPSEFVVKTFLNQGFLRERLARHIYGVDEKLFYPNSAPRDPKRGLTVLFVGVCAVRKGVHFALEAWLQSPARAGFPGGRSASNKLSPPPANECFVWSGEPLE